jgi:hypothetical protein
MHAARDGLGAAIDDTGTSTEEIPIISAEQSQKVDETR